MIGHGLKSSVANLAAVVVADTRATVSHNPLNCWEVQMFISDCLERVPQRVEAKVLPLHLRFDGQFSEDA